MRRLVETNIDQPVELVAANLGEAQRHATLVVTNQMLEAPMPEEPEAEIEEAVTFMMWSKEVPYKKGWYENSSYEDKWSIKSMDNWYAGNDDSHWKRLW